MGGPKRWVDFIFEKLKSLGEGGGGGRMFFNYLGRRVGGSP